MYTSDSTVEPGQDDDGRRVLLSSATDPELARNFIRSQKVIGALAQAPPTKSNAISLTAVFCAVSSVPQCNVHSCRLWRWGLDNQVLVGRALKGAAQII
jgi:hypothetical protein